jgi:hypothetical protein
MFEARRAESQPILGIFTGSTFGGCCAVADAQSARSMVQRTAIFFFIFFSALVTRHSPPLLHQSKIQNRESMLSQRLK